MPGQRHPDKTTLSVYVTRALHARLRKEARRQGKTVTDLVVGFLLIGTANVELTSADYEQIHREVRAAERKNSARLKAKSPDRCARARTHRAGAD